MWIEREQEGRHVDWTLSHLHARARSLRDQERPKTIENAAWIQGTIRFVSPCCRNPATAYLSMGRMYENVR